MAFHFHVFCLRMMRQLRLIRVLSLHSFKHPYLQAANDCDLEPVAYDFFTQAFVLYEEEVAVYIQYIH